MGNQNFDTKKEILRKTSHVKLNTKIIEKTVWTTKDITQRTNDLIDKIIKVYPYIESEYEEDYENEINIYYENNNTKASALFINENKVIILKESYFKYYDKSNTNSNLIEDINNMLEDNVIELNNDTYTFLKDYEFGSLSRAANVLIDGSNNGWDFWKLKNGKNISTIRNEVSQDNYYFMRNKLINSISEVLKQISAKDEKLIYSSENNSFSYIRFTTQKLNEYFKQNSGTLSAWKNYTHAYYELKVQKYYISLQIAFDISNTDDGFSKNIVLFENELNKHNISFSSSRSSDYHIITIKNKIKNNFLNNNFDKDLLELEINNL